MAIAIANRYARALADVVGRSGEYGAVLQGLEDFAAAYGESADLRELFETPAVTLAEKGEVVDALVKRLSAAPMTGNFLRVLAANYRMGLIREVAQAFRKVANDRLGIVEVRISSAHALSEAERKALGARFRELTHHEVQLEFHLEPELLGGIRAQIGSTVYDGSVRGQLERISRQLTGAS